MGVLRSERKSRAKGRAEGRARGRAEGRAKGRAEGASISCRVEEGVPAHRCGASTPGGLPTYLPAYLPLPACACLPARRPRRTAWPPPPDAAPLRHQHVAASSSRPPCYGLITPLSNLYGYDSRAGDSDGDATTAASKRRAREDMSTGAEVATSPAEPREPFTGDANLKEEQVTGAILRRPAGEAGELG